MEIYLLSSTKKNTPEAAQLLRYLDGHYQDLWAQLGEKGKEALEKYRDRHGELACIESANAFVKGFSLGVKLIAESLLSE